MAESTKINFISNKIYRLTDSKHKDEVIEKNRMYCTKKQLLPCYRNNRLTVDLMKKSNKGVLHKCAVLIIARVPEVHISLFEQQELMIGVEKSCFLGL